MSSEDYQHLLLSAQNNVRHAAFTVVSFVDQHVETVASTVRETLVHASWLPDSLKAHLTPPPPPPPLPLALPLSVLDRAQSWLYRNRVLTGLVLVTVGATAYHAYQIHGRGRKLRRARRAKNGGRLDAIVIAGSPALPLTRSLALDMERRGFVVYIVCGALEEENAVRDISRLDIKPLSIDITDPLSAIASIDSFARYLQTPHAPAPRAKPNILSLKSIILIPSLHYVTCPIATIPPSNFADLFNTHLLHPIVTIQAFLPLLTARLSPIGEKWTPAKVIVFTPSIISSINPPFHAPEATICSALSAFTEVLTAELRPLSIPVVHMQLGTFDFTGFAPASSSGRSRLLPSENSATDPVLWPDSARVAYGRNFASLSSSHIPPTRIKGSSLRRLHNTVFDVIDGSIASDTVRVGLGASLYGFVGRWAPRSLVSWMMGIRKVDELFTWQASSLDVSREASEDGELRNEFVAIPADSGLDGSVWKQD